MTRTTSPLLLILPCIYFAGLFLWMCIDNGTPQSLILAAPFAIHLFLRKRSVSLALGIVTLLLSTWLLLAYLWDVSKIDNYQSQSAASFIWIGLAIVLANFTMSIFLLVRSRK